MQVITRLVRVSFQEINFDLTLRIYDKSHTKVKKLAFNSSPRLIVLKPSELANF